MELEWRETITAGGSPVWVAYTDDKLYKLVVATRYFHGTLETWYEGQLIYRPTGKVLHTVPYVSPQTGMRGLTRRLAKY